MLPQEVPLVMLGPNDIRVQIIYPTLQLITVALVFALSACRSPRRRVSDTLAAVEIKGHTTMEVARTISEVFQAAGFEAVPLRPNNDLKMQFDKPGNTGDAVMYGDWSFKKVWYRAE
jgi:hypothetical protein